MVKRMNLMDMMDMIKRNKTWTVLKLFICLLCLMRLSLPARAAAMEDVIVVTCDACTPGNEYVLLIVKEGTEIGSLQDSDILFIDQYSVTDTSQFKAAVVIPGLSKCDVYIGGILDEQSNSPWKLASYSVMRMPGQLQTIEANAFEEGAFTHVILGEQVVSIEDGAFANCGELRYICIPNPNVIIAENAFSGCHDLTIGSFDGGSALQYAQDHGFGQAVLGQ